MPKETLSDLPTVKRRILEVAIDQSAEDNYRNVSVTRPVERSGIAKGRFSNTSRITRICISTCSTWRERRSGRDSARPVLLHHVAGIESHGIVIELSYWTLITAEEAGGTEGYVAEALLGKLGAAPRPSIRLTRQIQSPAPAADPATS